MKTFIVIVAFFVGLAVGADYETVGGNSHRTGYNPDWSGPRDGNVFWTATTLPSTLGMQVYTWDTLCVVGRYTFSPNRITVACHDLMSGDTVWTRNWSGTGKYLPFGVHDGRLYVRDFKETQHDSVFCISMATGEILWRSEHNVGLGIIWSAAFTDDGDLLVPGDSHRIFLLDHETGDTLWSCYRLIPTTGGECICVHGDRAFSWKGASNTPKRICAIDLATGVITDSSEGLPGSGSQQMQFTVGPGGVVYAPRDGGDLHALRYSPATGFTELWSAACDGGVGMQLGVGPDSTLYIPRGRRLFRLDHQTGATLDSSPELTSGDDLVPRISIDKDGYLYLSTGTYSGGGTWNLAPDLDTLWFDPMNSTYYTGPAVGKYGITVVSGPGNVIKAYEPAMGIAQERGSGPVARPALSARPSVFSDRVYIEPGPVLEGVGTVTVHDALGRLVREVSFESGRASWDGRDAAGNRVAPGVYVLRAGSSLARVTLQR